MTLPGNRKILPTPGFQRVTSDAQLAGLELEDGQALPVSNADEARLRYNNATDRLELSSDAAAYSAITADAQRSVFYPESYGAERDGVHDDRPAWQTAIDLASAAGGGDVVMGPGTYLMGSFTSLVPANLLGVVLRMKPNVRIIGCGQTSVLKLADSMNTPTRCAVLFGSLSVDGQPACDNVEFHNFTWDGNGENNIVAAFNYWGDAVAISASNRVLIDGVRARNNPGSHCFSTATMAVDPYTGAESLTVRNCSATNCGRQIAGNNNQTDHSAVYAKATNIEVHHNDFDMRFDDDGNPIVALAQFVTGIETHSPRGSVHHNRVLNCTTGFNVGGQVNPIEDLTFESNTASGGYRAITLWVDNANAVDGLHVVNNTFSVVDYGATPVDFSAMLATAVDGAVEFVGNTCEEEFTAGAAVSATSAYIQVGDVNQFICKGNTFRNTRGPALWLSLSGAGVTIDELEYSNNTLVDCARNVSAFMDCGLKLDSLGTLKLLRMHGNSVANTDPGTFTTEGVRSHGVLTIESLDIDGSNAFQNVPVYGAISGVVLDPAVMRDWEPVRFLLVMVNDGGTMKHQIVTDYVTTVVPIAARLVTGASATQGATPDAGVATAFVNGVGYNGAGHNELLFDVPQQLLPELAASCRIAWSNNADTPSVYPILRTSNVNGVTRCRLGLQFFIQGTLNGYAVDTGNLAAGEYMAIEVSGWVRKLTWTLFSGVVGSNHWRDEIKMQVGTGWGVAGAVSTRSIAADGYCAFKAELAVTVQVAGLCLADPAQDYTDIQFGFYLGGAGSVQVIESGVVKGAAFPYSAGVEFLVVVDGNEVRYYYGGVLQYTSLIAAGHPLYFGWVPNTQYASVQRVKVVG